LKLERKRKMSTLWFQRILVPLDDSLDVENAILVLERIARASGGTIELLGVSDIRSNPSGPQDLFSIELKKKGEQDQIDSVSSALQSDSIRVKPVDRLSNITEENILDTAAWITADLIVLFIEPKDLLLEEAAKEIERDSPLPLLLLHGEK